MDRRHSPVTSYCGQWPVAEARWQLPEPERTLATRYRELVTGNRLLATSLRRFHYKRAEFVFGQGGDPERARLFELGAGVFPDDDVARLSADRS